MILILSTPTDYDTNCVIDWLYFEKKDFFRLNDEDLMQGITKFHYNPKNSEDTYFEHFSQKISLKDIKIVWYRKFGFLRNYEHKIGSNNDLFNYMNFEFRSLSNLILKLLKDKKSLCIKNPKFSKLDILSKANNIGIKIPETIITTNKSILRDFFIKNNNRIITKSIGEAKYVEFKKKGFMFYTHNIENLEQFPENFSPSLFQEYLDKEIEIRTFYLDGKCYSMAIFSQNNEKTKLDFRNYDRENPNRFVPYKLPDLLEEKIKQFMESIGLNTGSLDIIKSSCDKNYYFLEVNPFGQFGMTSFPCNYNLHKKVADFLINQSNGN